MERARIAVAGLLCLLFMPLCASADDRSAPKKPRIQHVKVSFNKETLHAQYICIDARTDVEKEQDRKNGRLDGPVHVFFHGHAQRPSDSYNFTSKLAVESRSGIVIVPVVDTPYGDEKRFRGDAGKDVILMEMTRYVLALKGMTVKDYSPLTDLCVKIGGEELSPEGIPVELVAVGWSHGGILARRFCSAHPAETCGLAQVCPAGFDHWSVPELGLKFGIEALNISTLSFRGHAREVLDCTWGFTKGSVQDVCRSWGDAVVHLRPNKVFRPMKDAKDCAKYVDDSKVPVTGVERIVTIFGKDDTCIRASRTGVKDLESPDPVQVEAFWRKFYPGALENGTRTSLRFVKGTHAGPATNDEEFVHAVLDGLGELD